MAEEARRVTYPQPGKLRRQYGTYAPDIGKRRGKGTEKHLYTGSLSKRRVSSRRANPPPIQIAAKTTMAAMILAR